MKLKAIVESSVSANEEIVSHDIQSKQGGSEQILESYDSMGKNLTKSIKQSIDLLRDSRLESIKSVEVNIKLRFEIDHE